MKSESTTTQGEAKVSYSPKMVKMNYSKFKRRARLGQFGKRNNDGTFKGTSNFAMMRVRNDAAIYYPQRKKLKGWQKEARRHNRKAA